MQIDDGLLLWPNSWEVVRKMKGRTLIRAHWTLSENGKTLSDAFTQYLPDGTTLFLPHVYKQTSGKFRFSRHMGQRERESDEGDRAPDPALHVGLHSVLLFSEVDNRAA